MSFQVLSGLKVVEFSRGVAGPMAACRLADLGADVVKVEHGDGDWLRQSPPFLDDGRTGSAFFALNRGKRSVKLDDPAATPDLMRRLVEGADVFVTDCTPDELHGLDVGGVLEDECPFNSRLVTAVITGLGSKGPMAGKPSSELCAQAMAGYTRYVGTQGAPAVRLGADVAGVGTAIFAVQGILALLRQVARTGRGERVDLSLMNSLLSMKTVHLAAQSDPDTFEGPRVGGAYDPPERGWATGDMPVTFAFGGAVGAEGKPGWESFVQVVGLAHLLDDDRFDKAGRSTTGLGPKARTLKHEYEAEFRKRPAAEIVARIREFTGFAAPYLSHVDLMNEPQVAEMEIVKPVAGPGGAVGVLNYPANFDGRKPDLASGLAGMGEHTREVMNELAVASA